MPQARVISKEEYDNLVSSGEIVQDQSAQPQVTPVAPIISRPRQATVLSKQDYDNMVRSGEIIDTATPPAPIIQRPTAPAAVTPPVQPVQPVQPVEPPKPQGFKVPVFSPGNPNMGRSAVDKDIAYTGVKIGQGVLDVLSAAMRSAQVQQNPIEAGMQLFGKEAPPSPTEWARKHITEWNDAIEAKGIKPGTYVGKTTGGIGRSLPTMGVGLLGGAPGMIAAATAVQVDRSINEGKKAGLSGPKLAAYVSAQGAIEAGVASIFQLKGLGGAEAIPFAKDLFKNGLKPAMKEVAKQLAAENVEELITSWGQALTDNVAGVDNLTKRKFAEITLDTFLQTTGTMGLVTAARAVMDAKKKMKPEDFEVPPATEETTTPPATPPTLPPETQTAEQAPTTQQAPEVAPQAATETAKSLQEKFPDAKVTQEGNEIRIVRPDGRTVAVDISGGGIKGTQPTVQPQDAATERQRLESQLLPTRKKALKAQNPDADEDAINKLAEANRKANKPIRAQMKALESQQVSPTEEGQSPTEVTPEPSAQGPQPATVPAGEVIKQETQNAAQAGQIEQGGKPEYQGDDRGGTPTEASSRRSNEESKAQAEVAWTPPQDPDKRAELKQQIEDIIATKQANRQPIPQHLLDRLASINEVDSGLESTEGIGANVVYGSPLYDAEFARVDDETIRINDLLPIKASSRKSLKWRMEKAQGIVDKLQSRLVKRKGVKPLSTEEEHVLDQLRNKTLPELNRLYRLLPEAEVAPTIQQDLTVQAKQESTEDEYTRLNKKAEALLDKDNGRAYDKWLSTKEGKRYLELEQQQSGQEEDVGGSGPSGATGVRTGAMNLPSRVGKSPVAAADIIKKIEKVAGIVVRVGGVRWGKRLGIYKPGKAIVRQKEANALNVAAHEFGHAVHDRLVGWNTQFPAAEKAELTQAGKDLYGKKIPNGGYFREGFAEYIFDRLYGKAILGVDVAAKYPNFHAWFQDNVYSKKKELAKELDALEQMYQDYNDQGAIDRIAGQIHKEDTSITTRIKFGIQKLVDSWTTLVTNSEAKLDRATKRLIKEAGLTEADILPSMNPSKVIAALRQTAAGTAEHFISEGAVNISGLKVGDSLADALYPIKDRMSEWVIYAAARRSIDLHARGINPGITLQDAEYAARELESPEFRRALDEVTEWSGRLIDYLVESGGLSREQADIIRALNPVYVPFQRYFDPQEYLGGGKGAKSGYANQSSPIKRIKGSGRQIIDPVDALQDHALTIIKIANKMRVAKAVAEIAEALPDSGWFADKVTPKQAPTQFTLERIKSQLEDAGIDIENADVETLLTVFQNVERPYGKENIVTIWRNGQREMWELDKDVYSVLTSMDKDYVPAWVHAVFGKPKRMVQLGATGLNPSFSLGTNPVRDAQSWAIYSKKGMTPLGAMRGFWEEIRKTETANRFSALGLKMSTQMGQDRAEMRRKMEEYLARGVFEKGVIVAKHPVDAARELFGAFESAPRIAEFKSILEAAERKYGVGSESAAIEAMLAAKDVTIDFTRAGTVSRVINSVIPFFNAKIQGASKFYRTFSGASGAKAALRATTKGMVWLTLPSLLLWWINKDEEWYKDLPEWQRLGFWNFSLNGGKTIIRVPRPYELGYIFASIPEYLADKAYRGQDARAVSDAYWAAFKSFLPITNVLDTAPAAVKPAFEAYTNYDAFRDKAIVPEYMRTTKLPQDQYTQFTTETAKAIGDWLNVSPMLVEHALAGYTGGLGLSTVREAEAALNIKRNESYGARDLPVVDKFIARPGQSQALDDIYSTSAELTQKKGSGVLEPIERAALEDLGEAKKLISETRDKMKSGEIDKSVGEQTIVDTARRSMKSFRALMRTDGNPYDIQNSPTFEKSLLKKAGDLAERKPRKEEMLETWNSNREAALEYFKRIGMSRRDILRLYGRHLLKQGRSVDSVTEYQGRLAGALGHAGIE